MEKELGTSIHVFVRKLYNGNFVMLWRPFFFMQLYGSNTVLLSLGHLDFFAVSLLQINGFILVGGFSCLGGLFILGDG